jgi:hypothetical protein
MQLSDSNRAARPRAGLVQLVGYRLTRWADDWVVTCRTRAEAEHALARAGRILETLGVTFNQEKTRIVHMAMRRPDGDPKTPTQRYCTTKTQS